MRLALAFVLLSPLSAMAEPTIYVCDINGNGQDGFQDQLVIAHNVDPEVVSVSDALIVGVTGGPMLGEVSSENATRIVFSWTVRNVTNTTGQRSTLAYRATIFKADLALNISMRPVGFDNSFLAKGACKVQ